MVRESKEVCQVLADLAATLWFLRNLILEVKPEAVHSDRSPVQLSKGRPRRFRLRLVSKPAQYAHHIHNGWGHKEETFSANLEECQLSTGGRELAWLKYREYFVELVGRGGTRARNRYSTEYIKELAQLQD